jgi:hypothetical protein
LSNKPSGAYAICSLRQHLAHVRGASTNHFHFNLAQALQDPCFGIQPCTASCPCISLPCSPPDVAQTVPDPQLIRLKPSHLEQRPPRAIRSYGRRPDEHKDFHSAPERPRYATALSGIGSMLTVAPRTNCSGIRKRPYTL